MSHFTVTVALPGWLASSGKLMADTRRRQLEENLSEALAPFDENLVVERYVEYTREQLIAEGRKEIENYRTGLYAKYLEDPDGYAKEVNPMHLKYISEDFPKRLAWTDDEVYQHQVGYYEPEDVGADGEVYSSRNPKSQWDWWSIGGRWHGYWHVKEAPAEWKSLTHPSLLLDRAGVETEAADPTRTDVARVREILPESLRPTFAYVGLDGEWTEQGQMGWWGITRNEKAQDEWDEQYLRWVASLPADAWLVLVDCHI